MESSPGIPRWAWAIVTAVGVLVLWLTAPAAVRATFSSPATFARVAAVVLALALVGRVIGRVVPDRRLAAALRIVPAVAVAWWALAPYYSPSEVDEAFPVVAAEDLDTTTSAPATTSPVATAPGAAPTTAAPISVAPTTTAAVDPVLVRTGQFQGLTGHRGSGTASIYDLADGSRVLRFEDLDAGPGPDLDVYLVPRADARSLGDAVRVADLTAERGNQNYVVPADIDLSSGDWTVLIWCQSFAVEVANATLT